MIKRLYLTCIFILLLSLTLSAQQISGTISGVIHDTETGAALPLINVLLMNRTDSLVITGTTTAKNGRFALNNISAGQYLLKLSSIGYLDTLLTGITISKANATVNLGKLNLTAATIGLDEVVVSSKKELFTNTVDRKVYNLENDILSKSGSASDLLQNVPSVGVDIDGNITLRGSQDVLILINGKTSALLAKSSATVLEELPANSIERIEVITNPQVNFKPDGASGIINIVLKKNAAIGFNSSVAANVGNKQRYNGNINFGLNSGEYVFSGSYSFRHDNRSRLSSINRRQTDSLGRQTFYQESGSSSGFPVVHLLSLNAEVELAKSHKLGIEGSYFYQDATRNGIATQKFENDLKVITEDYDRLRKSPEIEKELEINLSYQKLFSEEGHEFTVNYKQSTTHEDESNYYSTLYRFPKLINEYENSFLFDQDRTQELIAHYSLPLSESSSLEAGLEGAFTHNSLDLKIETFNPNTQLFEKNLNQSSIFKNKEVTLAIFTVFSDKFGAFGYKTGLRFERAEIRPELVSTNQVYINNYANLYPTIHLQYTIDDTKQLSFNYSKRVNRPRDEDLNPFPEYQDPKNLRSGNPQLKPEYIHSMEVGLQVHSALITFIPSLYYRYTTNRFTQITKSMNDSVLLTAPQNLLFDKTGGLELVATSSLTNLLNAQFSFNYFYNQINAANLGYAVKTSNYSWNCSFSLLLHISKTTACQISSNYKSVRLTPQGEIEPTYVVNLGFKQELFDDAVTLSLTVSDIFNSVKYKNTLNTPALFENSIRKRDQSIYYLGLTYHFGKQEKPQDKIEFENGI